MTKMLCLWCRMPVTGSHPLGTPCPHCHKSPLLLTEGT